MTVTAVQHHAGILGNYVEGEGLPMSQLSLCGSGGAQLSYWRSHIPVLCGLVGSPGGFELRRGERKSQGPGLVRCIRSTLIAQQVPVP